MRGTMHGLIAIGEMTARIYNKLRGKEFVYKGAVSPSNLDAVGMIVDAESDVSVNGENPYGGTHISDKVSPREAAKMFVDVEESVDQSNYTYRTSISLKRGDLNFEIGQNDEILTAPIGDVATYEGTLAEDLEKEEVEGLLSRYGLDRHSNGWRFSIHGSLDDYQVPDENYAVDVSSLQYAILTGEVEEVEYFGKDYSDNAPDEVNEIVSDLLTGRSLGGIEVEETLLGSEHHYRINVEDVYFEDDALSMSLSSEEPLFEPEYWSEQVVAELE